MSNYTPNWASKTVRNKLTKLEHFANAYFEYTQVRPIHSKLITSDFGNQSPGHDLSIYFKELLLIRSGNYIPGSKSFDYMFSWNNLLWAFIQAGVITEDQVKLVIGEKLFPLERTESSSRSLCLTVFQKEKLAKQYFDYRWFAEYNSHMLGENVEYIEDKITTRLKADFQNKAKVIKAKFFAGFWDVDADAAGYTLIHQHFINNVLPWWGKTVLSFNTIEQVYKNKNQVRAQLSQDLGIPVPVVKEVLATILFDCKLVANPFSGVWNIMLENGINPDEFFAKAKSNQFLKNLISELRLMWPRCMSYWNNQNGKSGRRIFRTERVDQETGEIKYRFKPSRFRARIYFELERKMLDVIRKEMDGKLCHLMHDGFFCQEKPDMDKIKLRIKEETSFDVTFSMKQY